MSHEEKLQAVAAYLQAEFPDGKIEIKREPAAQIHRFQISRQGPSHFVIVVEGFLESFAVDQIGAILQDFMVAEHLREMGATPVVVTPEGLKLEGE